MKTTFTLSENEIQDELVFAFRSALLKKGIIISGDLTWKLDSVNAKVVASVELNSTQFRIMKNFDKR